MKRIGILASMSQFLERQGITSAFEVLILPQAVDFGVPTNIRKQRSIFIVGLQQADQAQLETFLTDNGIVHEHRSLRFYANLNALQNSDLISPESFSIENNWRGRILRFDRDFNWQIDFQEFQRVFLQSYIRLIISFVNGEYFGKHDVAPVFYNPGQSTAGFNDFRGAVESVVKFVNRGREIERCPVDPDFDILRVFVSTGAGQAYIHLNLNINGQHDILMNSLYERIDANDENQVSDWLYNSINVAWNRP